MSALTLPDWSRWATPASLRYVVLFAMVGSLESLLSARAIDQLDSRRLASDYDRDLWAVGLGNTVCGLVGGLPMIAEIVRSKANLDAGARSRWANFFHGGFLLVFVAFLPWLIHRVPLAALAAMLTYTGWRLASPSEFRKTWAIGREQLAVFLVTMVGCMAIDLLVGVALGIVTKVLIELALGARVRDLLSLRVETRRDGETVRLLLQSSATFTNYLGLESRIRAAAAGATAVVVDLAAAPLVDHTTLERLHDLGAELREEGKSLQLVGLERLRTLSEHPMAVRRSIPAPRAAE